MFKTEIRIRTKAKKQLKKAPAYVKVKLLSWVDSVLEEGLEMIRQCAGYHDEPLQGKREGQRSIRLSRSYRAIYTIDNRSSIKIIEIREVTKHEY